MLIDGASQHIAQILLRDRLRTGKLVALPFVTTGLAQIGCCSQTDILNGNVGNLAPTQVSYYKLDESLTLPLPFLSAVEIGLPGCDAIA